MTNAPSDLAIKRLARKNPDRWAQTVAIFARLSGYADKTDHNVNGLLAMVSMSDSQLKAEIERLENEVKTIEAEPLAITDLRNKGMPD